MVRIHIYRTEARTYCGLDPRVAVEGSRSVTGAHYDRAAERFAAGVVPGSCMDCVEDRRGAAEEERKATARARRAARKKTT